LGSSGHEFGLGVTTDSSDNIYVTGMTYDDVVCTRFPFKCVYVNRDLFLIKYNSSGTKQWTKHYGENGKGVTTDSSGNIYVTSYTDSDKSDIILIKYNSSGTKQWTKKMGASSGTYGDYGFDVTPDSSGNIYLSGHTYRGDFDGKIDNSPRFRTETDLFLVNYNSSGKRQWTKQLKTFASDWGGGVTTDSSGNIYMGATTDGGLNGCTYGSRDIALTKFNSSGKRKWIKAFYMCGKRTSALQLGTSELEGVRGITTDSLGNIYMTGYTYGDFGWWEKNKGRADIFLTKINSSGTVKWIRQLGTSEYEDASGVTTDSSDNIYVTGNTQGDFDGNTHLGGECEGGRGKIQHGVGTITGGNTVCNDIFLVKYNSSGTKQWTKLLGTSKDDVATSVTTDSSDNIYVTGTTQGGLDGNTNSGKDDIFLVKFNSDGVKQ